MEEGKLNYKNSRMYVGIGWAQGGRPYMQDAFSVVLTYDEDPCTDFLGVFDGHGPSGGEIARYVAVNLFSNVMHKYLRKNMNLPTAIEKGFFEVDEGIKLEHEIKGRTARGGTTAVAVWIRHGRLFCAHVGDSRAVLSRGGKAVPITADHKPDAKPERMRIEKAGGVVLNNRVLGVLGVARSFADFGFKNKVGAKPSEQMVTIVPDIAVHQLSDGVDFVVLATDGIWDVMSNQEVVDFVAEQVKAMVPLQAICEELVNECKVPFLTQTGYLAQDNMTVVLGIFK